MELQTHRVVSHFLSLTGRCYMNKGSHCPLDTSHPSSGIPALNIWNALLGCVFFFFFFSRDFSGILKWGCSKYLFITDSRRRSARHQFGEETGTLEQMRSIAMVHQKNLSHMKTYLKKNVILIIFSLLYLVVRQPFSFLFF